MDDRTKKLLKEMARGGLPETIPADCEYADELRGVLDHLASLHQLTLSLCRGDLSREMGKIGGPIAGSLKGLQANLRHLTWQTKQIAAGDFTQRVEFMGDFSTAFNAMVQRLGKARAELIHHSTHDALTGLYNRIFFDTEFTRLQQGRDFPISFVIADINGLKQTNDHHGHAVGDLLIIQTATLLRKALRADDILARIGGDEFAVIMPRTDVDTAEEIVRRLRQSQSKQDDAEPRVYFALGAGTAYDPCSLIKALKEADDRMYRDKGRWKECREGPGKTQTGPSQTLREGPADRTGGEKSTPDIDQPTGFGEG